MRCCVFAGGSREHWRALISFSASSDAILFTSQDASHHDRINSETCYLKSRFFLFFKLDFREMFFFKYEFMKHMSLMKVIRENDRQFLLMNWIFVFLSYLLWLERDFPNYHNICTANFKSCPYMEEYYKFNTVYIWRIVTRTCFSSSIPLYCWSKTLRLNS